MMQIRTDSRTIATTVVRTAAVLLWVLAFGTTTFADQVPKSVVDIRIEGNETIPASWILQRIESQANRPITARMVLEDERTLRRTRAFSHVQSRYEDTPQGPVLVFRVREKAIVRNVRFIGNDKVKTKHLVSWTGLEDGVPFDHLANEQAVSRIKQEYQEKGHLFVDVKLEKGGQPGDRDVVIRINEGPVVRVVKRTFRGAGEISAGSLRKNLITKSAWLGMFKGIYRPETLKQDVAALKDYYRRIGYFDAEVTAEPEFSTDRSAVRVVYNVDEGQRYRVGHIEFDGNRLFSSEALSAASRVNEGDFFNSNKLTKDITDMLAPYWDRGHYYADIVPVPRFTEKAGVVDLVFQVDEDRQRYVRYINPTFSGDSPYTRQDVLLSRLQIHPGDLADPRLIRRGRQRASSSQVFQAVDVNVTRVDPETELFAATGGTFRGQQPMPGSGPNASWLDEFSTAIDDLPALRDGFDLYKTSKSPVTHEATAVDIAPRRSEKQPKPVAEPEPVSPGKPDVSHQFILPEAAPVITYRPVKAEFFQRPWGQLLTPEITLPPEATVIRAQSPGQYYPGNDPGRGNAILEGGPFYNEAQALPPGFVDINAIASEGRTGRVMFGAGVNSDNGVVGSFVWEENNFDLFAPPRNFSDVIDGRAFRGGGQRFRAEAAPGDIVSRYAINWVDQYFMQTDYALSLSGFYYNRFFDDWEEARTGGRIGVGKQFTPEASVNATLRLEQVDISNPTVPTPAVLTQSLGSNFLSTIRVSATNDTRDSSILPGDGHFLEGAFEQAFSDFTYSRFDGEGRRYFTLFERPDGSGRQVVTLSGKIGFSTNDTPVFERYYAGGFQSFRGFAFRGVSPQVGGVAIGGTFQALGTVEYRLPVTADDMIQVVTFGDFGTVDNRVSFDRFRATVGVGLRVMIPAMGQVPLAFDFGFPVAKEVFDDERIFSFYVGILQ